MALLVLGHVGEAEEEEEGAEVGGRRGGLGLALRGWVCEGDLHGVRDDDVGAGLEALLAERGGDAAVEVAYYVVNLGEQRSQFKLVGLIFLVA